MEWYYAADKQQKGPVSEEQFAELVRSGVIQPNTLVWRQGMAAWLPYSQVMGGAPAAAPGTPPAPSQTPAPLAGLNFTNVEADRERALAKVKAPAICLMIYAGVLIGAVLLSILGVVAGGGYQEMPGMDPQMAEIFKKIEGPSRAVGIGVNLIAAIVIFAGAWRMMSLKNYGLAMAASICACLPCSCPCCFLGLAFGIWSLVVLSSSEVKAQFD